jgi:Sec-independent protein secretion pathway component TatC
MSFLAKNVYQVLWTHPSYLLFIVGALFGLFICWPFMQETDVGHGANMFLWGRRYGAKMFL